MGPNYCQQCRRGKSLLPNESPKSAASTASGSSPVKKKKSSSKSAQSYTGYIFRILRHIKPGMRITRRAMSIMNSFVMDNFERIATEAGKLCTYAKKDTLTSNEIRTAVRLVIRGDLSKQAISEGVAAVQTFETKNAARQR